MHLQKPRRTPIHLRQHLFISLLLPFGSYPVACTFCRKRTEMVLDYLGDTTNEGRRPSPVLLVRTVCHLRRRRVSRLSTVGITNDNRRRWQNSTGVSDYIHVRSLSQRLMRRILTEYQPFAPRGYIKRRAAFEITSCPSLQRIKEGWCTLAWLFCFSRPAPLLLRTTQE